MSSLVLGIAGVLVFYALLYKITKNRLICFISALTLLVNPFYFSLSNTFMTDVPFLAFIIISVYFFYKTSETGKLSFLVYATVFAVMGTLIRQFGVVVPIAYGLAGILTNKKIKEKIVLLLPAIVTITALLICLQWLKHIGSELRPYYGRGITDFLGRPGDIAWRLFDRIGFLLFNTSIFLLPLTITWRLKEFRVLAKRQKIYGAVLILVFIPTLIHTWSRVPQGNIANMGSIGPSTLRDASFNFMPALDNSPGLIGPLSVICFLSSILLLLTVFTSLVSSLNAYKAKVEIVNNKFRLFIVLCVLGYGALLFIPDFFFDRYSLPFIFFFSVLVIGNRLPGSALKGSVFFSLALIVLTAMYSVFGTHDYLALSRTRWEATDYLTRQYYVPANKIDGGYEFNGWVIGSNYDPVKNRPIEDNEYIISMEDISGYHIIRKFSYRNHLTCQTRNLCIYKRD